MIHALPTTGPLVTTATVTDVIGETWGTGAEWVVIPVERLEPGFFALATGIAGEIAQKFSTYHLKLAVVGDISEHLAASGALRDLVREVNQGRQFWFVPTAEELHARLGGAADR